MKSPELSEFFSLLGKAKKEKEEEFDNLLKEANINLDVLVKTVSSGIKKAKVEVKEQKKKGEKFIEQLDVVLEDVAKPPKTPEVVIGVPEDFDIESLEEENEEPVVEEIQEEEKEEDAITKAIKFIEDTTVKEEVENSDVDVQSEIRKLKNILNRVLAQGPGSGEVNLLKLDDVDEDSAKVDGKFLKYQSSTGKFVGADASGGGGSVGAGSTWAVDSVGINTSKSVGIGADAVSGIKLNVAGKIQLENQIKLRSDDGSPARIDLYCEVNNAHYLRLQAPPHAQFSGTPTVVLPNTAGTIALTSSNITGTSAGLSGTPNITVGAITNTTITGSSNASFYNQIKLRSDDSTPARIDLYCESNNAHYLRLQAPPHSQFSGNPTVVLPNSAGTLLLSDGSGADLTNLNASNLGSGTIPDARFPSALPAIDGSALTGIGAGSTDNIRTNTNATFLQNINVSGTTTATNFIGGGANITSINASNIASGTIGAARIPTLNQDTTGTSGGLTGTPNITVGSIIASTGTFSGNVTIGGTLTYEDVTNIDSVGLVTARSGLVVGTGVTLSKDGDGFYTGIVTATTFVGGLTGNVTGNVSGSSGSTTGNAATATALESARTIGGVSFDGTSNIDLPGVNATGSQDTTGNAATATILANARTIAGTSFNGSANIDIDFDNLTNKPTIPTNNNQLTNGAGFITGSALNASNLNSGTIPDARFPSVLPAIDGSALTGIAVTDNIRTNTNATFLQNVNVSGTTTATTFIGDLTGDVTGTASNATLAVSAQGLTGSPNVTVTNVNAVDAIISGNLSVAGTITSLDQNDILATGIITASSGVDLGDPGIVTLSSDTLTTTSTSQDTISSISATVNRSATFQVQVTRGSEYHVTTINVVHDGTNAFLSEYGTIRTGSILATFDADISGGNLRLRATPTTTASTVFKLSKTTIKV